MARYFTVDYGLDRDEVTLKRLVKGRKVIAGTILGRIGTLHRGYTHPFHPLPALSLALIAALVMFATFLGYGTTLLTLLSFYLLASVWFVVFRYRYVRRGSQFPMPWPRPKGY